MEETKYQKELFEFEPPKKSFPKLDGMLPKSNFAVMLTMEKFIFVAIAIVMVMVAVYALGVERGKIVAKANFIKAMKAQTKAAPIAITPKMAVAPKVITTAKPLNIQKIPVIQPAGQKAAAAQKTAVAPVMQNKPAATTQVKMPATVKPTNVTTAVRSQ
jgi:hypothetical protein